MTPPAHRPPVHLIDDAAGQLPAGPPLVLPGIGGGVVGPGPAVDALGLTLRPGIREHRLRAVQDVAVVELTDAVLRQGRAGAPPALLVALHRDPALTARAGRPHRTDPQLDRLRFRSPDGEVEGSH